MKTVSITTYKAFLDQLKIAVEEKSWTTVRDTLNGDSREIIFKSPNDAICGFKEYSNASTYYNIAFMYANEYSATQSFWNQPGANFNFPDNSTVNSDIAPGIPLHNNTMNCFFFINVNRIVIVVNALSRYISGYVGRYVRKATQLQIPNNLIAGGSLNSGTLIEPLNSTTHLSFLYKKSLANNVTVFKDELGQPQKISTQTVSADIYPFGYYNTTTVDIKDENNNHVLIENFFVSDKYMIGNFDGIFAFYSPLTLTPENEFTAVDPTTGNLETFKTFIDINKTTYAANFFAVRKD